MPPGVGAAFGGGAGGPAGDGEPELRGKTLAPHIQDPAPLKVHPGRKLRRLLPPAPPAADQSGEGEEN